MKKLINNLKNMLIPCFLLSSLAGIITGAFIFLFKVASSKVISFSGIIYDAVRNDPLLIAPFILGMAVLGVVCHFIITLAPDCKGGGIPTALTILRGFISFNWVPSAFVLFVSALVTFFGGVPLGNEGPSVQMGCALGKGTVNIFAKKNRAWDRYIMTGGACAGFCAATGSPLSGLLFAIEEVHHRFSPLIFMSVSAATLSSAVTMRILGSVFGVETALFHFTLSEVLPYKFIPVAIGVGIVSGIAAVGFTKLYVAINKLINETLKKFPSICKIVLIFVIVGILGLLSGSFTGSGHSLIDEIIEGHAFAPLILVLFILVRALLLLFANNAGITGGLFVPSLAFGAILGKIISSCLVMAGLLPENYEVIIVIIGMASFLSAVSRIPLTAIAFSLEALSGLSNIIPIAIGCALAYITVETIGVTEFCDTVIEHKIHSAKKGKKLFTADVHMKVEKGAFVVGQEIRNILWPPTCVVMSVDKQKINEHTLDEGDVLHLRYKTTDPEDSLDLLESILGKQTSDIAMKFVHGDDEHYSIPEA